MNELIDKEPLNLSLSYTSLPSLIDSESSTSLLPVSQYRIEPDSLPTLERDNSFVTRDIQDVYYFTENAKNSTSYNRKLVLSGVRAHSLLHA